MDIAFLEIGTSNFDSLIESAHETTRGISIDPIQSYLDDLPDKPNVKKICCAVTSHRTSDRIDIYYIPKLVIEENKLQHWFKGCNTIGNYHPLHIQHNVTHLVKVDKVPIVNIDELLESNNVRSIGFLKIDTEGHDCVILQGLFEYLKDKSTEYFPRRILFESNENTPTLTVDETIEFALELGYKVASRGYDTELFYDGSGKRI